MGLLGRAATVAVVSAIAAHAQRPFSGAAENQLALARLNSTASVLMIAAHPDDENNALLAYLSLGRKARTGYLSLTRGEGGQNVIGPEQGYLLGVIRTQELLAARRIDRVEQFFTRAVDFGFSKTAEETLTKWDRDAVLGDIVWVIRNFRPDVIILRFSGTSQDGHGQHQASAILGKEAFTAAVNPAFHPEQLEYVKPWQAKRLLWNVFAFTPEQRKLVQSIPGKIEIDTGEFDPVLGYSYTEIAGLSRSLNRTQAMGSPQRRGPAKEYLTNVAGQPAAKDLFDGIETSWKKESPKQLLGAAAADFNPKVPEKTIATLLKARTLIDDERRKHDLDEAIALCSGLSLEAVSDRGLVPAGSTVRIKVRAINRSHVVMQLVRVSFSGIVRVQPVEIGAPLDSNAPKERDLDVSFPREFPPRNFDATLPEPEPILTANFQLQIGTESITLSRPVRYRHVDRVRGELEEPLEMVPPVSVSLQQSTLLFPNDGEKRIAVRVRSFASDTTGALKLEVPENWSSKPDQQAFRLNRPQEETSLEFAVKPAATLGSGAIEARSDGNRLGVHVLDYEHIPRQVVQVPASGKVVRADVKTLAENVGYVMGAGDSMPEALQQMGCTVTLLSDGDLAGGDLSRFDAILTGVRAYNVRLDLRANQHRLLDYVKAGGTLVVQYNVLERDGELPANIGPYPLKIGRRRISVETAPVSLQMPKHPVLQIPNQIGQTDFEGWIQERGLYFPSEWDSHYDAVLSSHDPGEEPLTGGVLCARYGKGTYIYTSFAWFRQLPSGVPGAYRIFANLLSAGKANAQPSR